MRARSALVLAALISLITLAPPRPAAAYDAFSDSRTPARFAIAGPDALRLVIKGDARFGLYDLEGDGGVGHDSTTDTATLGTRSAFAALDHARLAFRLETGTPLAFYSALRFEPTQSYVEGAWIDVRARLGDGFGLHGELGLHTPFAATDRLTHRAPLAERIYWYGPEMHAQVIGSRAFGSVSAWLGASAAMMRPLGLTPVNDASNRGGTLAVLHSKQNRPFSGNEPVFGGKVGVGYGDMLSFEGFGFAGTLAREAGTDELANSIPYYTPRERRAALAEDTTFWWAGGRLDCFTGGAELRFEAIASRESALSRWTAYAQLGYGIDGFGVFFGRFTPRLRLETYRIVDGARLRAATPSKGLTWDWDIATLALETLVYRDVIRLHLEYSVIGETNEGDGGAPLAGLFDEAIANNELTAQFELRF